MQGADRRCSKQVAYRKRQTPPPAFAGPSKHA
jgi:hypothetical protein